MVKQALHNCDGGLLKWCFTSYQGLAYFYVDRVLILGYHQVRIENDSHFQYHDAGELL